MIGTLRHKIDGYRALRVRQTSHYWQATADIPATLYPSWKRTAQFEFKGIPQDVFFFASATEGLLTFFDCVRTSGKPCGLPSAAADSVWHAWAALDQASLDAFCIKHFGQLIPHIEGAGMGGNMEAALATCMVTARELEGRDPARPSVPSLFALDRKLRMPGGFGYQLALGDVAYRRLDAQGKPEGDLYFTRGLMSAQLLAAGLISQGWHDHIMKKQKGGSCGSAGSACGSSSACDGGGGSCCGGCGS